MTKLKNIRFLCAHCFDYATCYGSYEGQKACFACDKCCGHGNEDGHCHSCGNIRCNTKETNCWLCNGRLI